ncbi:hypothetical protein QOL99_00410 [Deinococcus sp. MIMF12]|uniref:Uncharacterized protein n=1 Tax=Deinococcus rhizophilus TaxID=3049544 RepID=A0ABT7JC56_9DEIO|nr:hypothetical protein [Deinococcus rhizophilus]MDL2342610.1 hypothetical protein [Deinococcus rhizophilus]
MSSASRPSIGSGNGTDPREIIYLDRGRLLSYASQLFDGVTVMRRLLEASQHGDIISTLERERETSKEARRTGSAGLNLGAELKGEAERTEGERTLTKTGGDQKLDLAYTALLEEKAELDNVLLIVERELEQRGLLTDFDGSAASGLVRFQGSLSFVDWTILQSVMADFDTFNKAFGGATQGMKAQDARAFAKLLKILSLSDITAHMTAQELTITSPLNPEHLTLTLEQMRAVYLPQEIEATLLAFMPPPATTPHTRTGIGASINFEEVLGIFMGETDHTVQPVALYVQLRP